MMIDTLDRVWFDGRLVGIKETLVSPLAYGLHYGWGVYEGLRAYDTKNGRAVFRLRDHMTRFLDSARFMQLEVKYTVDELCDAVKEICRANGPQADYIRPLAYYGENGELGLGVANIPTHVAIMTVHMGAYIRGGSPGASLITSSWERPSNMATSLTAKICGNYINSILAKREAMRQGADEALMLNHSGSVAEASAENVFMVRHGKLITPGLSEGILEGITRDTVITLARERGYEVVERSITRGEIVIADEVFLTGTAAELHPVRSIDGITLGKEAPGPITAELRDLYTAVARGESEDHSDWVDLIDQKPARRRKK
jgi:branched-chain amino acid aminotransferase